LSIKALMAILGLILSHHLPRCLVPKVSNKVANF